MKLSNSKKTYLLNLIANPFFLALPIALIVIFFLPNPTSKYKIELTNIQITNKANSYEYFEDLNNDSIDEHIIIFHNSIKKQAAIKILNNNDFTIDQWNFDGKYETFSTKHFVADLDNDGFSEIYLFFHKDDSVFMAAIQPFPNEHILFKKKFIATINKVGGKTDYIIKLLSAIDINNDKNIELVFALTAGYSKQPRQIFIYHHQSGKLSQSKSCGINYTGIVYMDLDYDSIPEIYSGSYASANIHDSINIKYSDQFSWLSIMDNQLNIIDKPIKCKNYTITLTPFKNNHDSSFLCILRNNNSLLADSLIFYGKNFTPVSSYGINTNAVNTPIYYLEKVIYNEEPFILTNIQNGDFLLINEKLQTHLIPTKLQVGYFIMSGDLNNDGKKEYIFKSRDQADIYIFDNNFRNPAIINSEIHLHNKKPNCLNIKTSSNKTEFVCQVDDYLYYYEYSMNYLYYMKFMIWLFVYLSLVLLLWASQKLQKMQALRKQRIEETINNLQMRTIKSQMDPHFMFNVLNGLAYNVTKGNSEDVHEQILRFSTLLRSMMKRVDKIDTTLDEEISFVSSYLELEKFRFKENFEYEININESVNKQLRLPRMLIQLNVENSIKHGLRNKEGLKKIAIKINTLDLSTVIIIEDNGIGRKNAQRYKTDSGRGTKLISEMIALNKKMGGKNITYKYIDLFAENGNAIGTQVKITYFT